MKQKIWIDAKHFPPMGYLWCKTLKQAMDMAELIFGGIGKGELEEINIEVAHPEFQQAVVWTTYNMAFENVNIRTHSNDN